MIKEITCDELLRYQVDIEELLRLAYEASFDIEESALKRIVSEKFIDLSRNLRQQLCSVIVCIEDDEVLGFLWYFLKTDCGISKYFINFIATKSSARKKGIASHIIAYLKNLASTNSISQIELIVTSENEAAIQLYEKHAFTEYRKVMILETEKNDKKDNIRRK